MAQSGHLHDHSKHVSFLSRVESIGFVLILLFWSGIILSHQAIGAEKSPSVRPQPSTNSADPFVEEINQFIREGWKENDLEPSPAADDEEWIRRISLDLHGHIPDLEEAEQFLSDKSPVKRANTIDRMLSDSAYTRNWTTIWTNLCIGQQTPRNVSRDGMKKFFREAFGKNRPWKDVVNDLITAEGHFEQNGAVNFLLAQMQDQDDGVQATAKATRLFLGMQVQCTQCHNHPFNDWKQDQFWQFNSFFRQARKVDHRKYNPKTGRMDDDYSEITSRDFSGPVYFEKRNGLMQVAFPIYLGQEIDPSDATDRRKELAKLMTEGDNPLIARAFVNRMWSHFFGHGFTRPVDDSGPHNPPSHPELLDRLSTEFVNSGYDVKRLMRWITNTEAYGLTSKVTAGNATDDPSLGETPRFTHVSVKPMTAEQLYDSLIVATNAHTSGRSGWEQSESRRQEWLQQFVQAFGTDEGDEASSFDGTIPQALMMMNGELVSSAINSNSAGRLSEILASKGNDVQKIRKLYMTVLCREPSKKELSKLQPFLKGHADHTTVFQDLYWALLNSNEFIFNH